MPNLFLPKGEVLNPAKTKELLFPLKVNVWSKGAGPKAAWSCSEQDPLDPKAGETMDCRILLLIVHILSLTESCLLGSVVLDLPQVGKSETLVMLGGDSHPPCLA